MTLAPCPCGKTPTDIHIVPGYCVKYAMATGNCCAEWHVEFRTEYKKEGSAELHELAVEAWNEAQRSPAAAKALAEAIEVLSLCQTRTWEAPEDPVVRVLCENYGYGAVMAAASKLWADKARENGLDGSQHTAGPCEATVERTLNLLRAALEGDS